MKQAIVDNIEQNDNIFAELTNIHVLYFVRK